LIAALLFQVPPESGAAQGTPSVLGSSALVEMVRNSGPVAMAVLVVLLIASLYSWTVIFGKMSSFRKATRESQPVVAGLR
jgi:biopolymer transport protein TolQ